MKKRGFGAGKFNGVGGKVEINESIISASVREVKEEIFVTIKAQNLIQVATLTFIFKDNPDWNIECHTFFIYKWEGIPKESEEMNPEWFDISKIPYEKMWVDDPYWLPHVLSGKKITATFNFKDKGGSFDSYKIEGSNL